MTSRVLLLRTGLDWLVRAWLAETRARGEDLRVSILTNAEPPDDHAFENIHRFPSGKKLSLENVTPAVIEEIRRERYDGVAMLMAYKIPAMYAHVFEFIRRLGFERYETFFQHAPSGDYDSRYREGFWSEAEAESETYLKAFLDHIKTAPGDNPRILDIGCGRGAFTNLFRKLGYSRVAGTDLSMVGLKAARTRFPGLPLVKSDAYRAPFRKGLLDIIFLRAFPGVAIDLDPLLDFGRACRELLAPGGWVIQTQPSIDMSGDPKGDPVTVRYLSESQLGRYFRALGYSRPETFFTDRESLSMLGAAAFDPETSRTTAEKALSDIRFHVTTTFARKDS